MQDLDFGLKATNLKRKIGSLTVLHIDTEVLSLFSDEIESSFPRIRVLKNFIRVF